jgi:hypothetical protein
MRYAFRPRTRQLQNLGAVRESMTPPPLPIMMISSVKVASLFLIAVLQDGFFHDNQMLVLILILMHIVALQEHYASMSHHHHEQLCMLVVSQRLLSFPPVFVRL